LTTLAEELSNSLVEAAVATCQHYLADKRWLAQYRQVANDLSYVKWQVMGSGKLSFKEMERVGAILKTYGWHSAMVCPVFHNEDTNWELTVVHKS